MEGEIQNNTVKYYRWSFYCLRWDGRSATKGTVSDMDDRVSISGNTDCLSLLTEDEQMQKVW